MANKRKKKGEHRKLSEKKNGYAPTRAQQTTNAQPAAGVPYMLLRNRVRVINGCLLVEPL